MWTDVGVGFLQAALRPLVGEPLPRTLPPIQQLLKQPNMIVKHSSLLFSFVKEAMEGKCSLFIYLFWSTLFNLPCRVKFDYTPLFFMLEHTRAYGSKEMSVRGWAIAQGHISRKAYLSISRQSFLMVFQTPVEHFTLSFCCCCCCSQPSSPPRNNLFCFGSQQRSLKSFSCPSISNSIYKLI